MIPRNSMLYKVFAELLIYIVCLTLYGLMKKEQLSSIKKYTVVLHSFVLYTLIVNLNIDYTMINALHVGLALGLFAYIVLEHDVVRFELYIYVLILFMAFLIMTWTTDLFLMYLTIEFRRLSTNINCLAKKTNIIRSRGRFKVFYIGNIAGFLFLLGVPYYIVIIIP